MEDILDQLNVKNTKTIYTNISFVCSVFLICCLGFIFSYIPAIFKAMDSIIRPPQFVVWINHFVTIVGFVMVIMSFSKGEPSSWKKWFAAVVNISIFILVVASISFYYFVGIDI